MTVDEFPEGVLYREADKERTYLEQFGRPLWPYHRERRDFYGYQKQLPSDYLLLLDDYLRMAPHLVPKDPALSHFRIRHPDLRSGRPISSSLGRLTLTCTSLA